MRGLSGRAAPRRHALRWFHYNLTATTPAPLTALLDLVPASHLVAGLDHPHMPTSTYAESIEQLRLSPLLTPEDRRRTSRDNAAALFPAVAVRATTAAVAGAR